MSGKHIKRFIKTESLPDNIRSAVFEHDLMVFPPSILIHPEAISACIFDSYDTQEGVELLNKCPYFEYEDDYKDDANMMLVCMHCYSNGAGSFCEIYTDPALLTENGILMLKSEVVYGQ